MKDSMKVDFAFLCDYADASNKIFASGIGIDTILARQVPVRHPQLFVVVQVRAPSETERKLEIRLKAPGGATLINQIGTLRFTRQLNGKLGLARFSMGFYSLELPGFGEYQFEILVQGEPPIQLAFQLLQVGAASRLAETQDPSKSA
ncbi:MAG: hypothetical protein AMXMBFR33_71080 [Candidatus Xenobia bacterium]